MHEGDGGVHPSELDAPRSQVGDEARVSPAGSPSQEEVGPMERSLRNSPSSDWKEAAEEPVTIPLFSIGDCHASYVPKQLAKIPGDRWAWDISPYNYALCALIENKICNGQDSNNTTPNGPLQGNGCN
jgi:hypothetical protein